MVQRIAMWSGPRNLSTAMMYSFGNRADMAAVDEPFYAAYLAASGLDHPMRDAVLASQPTAPADVAADLAKADGHRYFKLMAHHMLPGFPMDWAAGAVHIHLVRHPARVIASYSAKRETPTLEDIGFPQQLRLIDDVGGFLVDSFDIRRDPENTLARICNAAGLSFDPAMLAWETGSKPFEGAWAPHWYDAVHKSTGFAGPEGPEPELTGDAARLLDKAAPMYRAMWDRAEALI